MWLDLGVALALMMVVEGVLPALSPDMFRRVLITLAQMDDRTLRNTGLISMVLGAVLVYLLRN